MLVSGLRWRAAPAVDAGVDRTSVVAAPMKTMWRKERRTSKRVDYVNVYKTHVEVGCHFGSGHTDNAGTCSFDAFLGGRWHDEIKATFGDRVLEEVIATVDAMTTASSP